MSVLRTTAIIVAALASLPLAACGSGGEKSTKAQPAEARNGVAAAGGQAMIDAQIAFARCMREQGIDFPDPQPGGGTEFDPGPARIDENRVKAAEKKCARYQRAIADAAPKRSRSELEQELEMGLRYARCMRVQGQDIPDPRPADAGAISVPADAKTNPAFQRANRKCDHILRDLGP